jgi:hypothetical protein
MLGAALGRGQAVQEAAVATGRPLYPFGRDWGTVRLTGLPFPRLFFSSNPGMVLFHSISLYLLSPDLRSDGVGDVGLHVFASSVRLRCWSRLP